MKLTRLYPFHPLSGKKKCHNLAGSVRFFNVYDNGKPLQPFIKRVRDVVMEPMRKENQGGTCQSGKSSIETFIISLL